jgi:hypothetical protein
MCHPFIVIILKTPYSHLIPPHFFDGLPLVKEENGLCPSTLSIGIIGLPIKMAIDGLVRWPLAAGNAEITPLGSSATFGGWEDKQKRRENGMKDRKRGIRIVSRMQLMG